MGWAGWEREVRKKIEAGNFGEKGKPKSAEKKRSAHINNRRDFKKEGEVELTTVRTGWGQNGAIKNGDAACQTKHGGRQERRGKKQTNTKRPADGGYKRTEATSSLRCS